MGETKAKTKSKFLTYKGRPLVRSGNTIYYGNMWEKCVVIMQIINTKKVFDNEISGTVAVQLVSTDAKLKINERIIRQTEKEGLYSALDIASIWLSRELDQ